MATLSNLLPLRCRRGLAALVLAAPLAAAAAEPPRIGLVLGGGGARGAAHVGVLEVLERLRVPVHCIAGTSMGALVAGAWAAGVSPERMRAEMTIADWGDMFQDNPDYAELNFRNKRLSQRFLPGSELGVTPQGVVAPPGVVSGQKIKLFFNQLLRADLGVVEMQKLRLPIAIVATDIGNGERVVFREGDITQAMRASMSVPGLMAPAEIGGRKLVDGGLVDNLPVAEVRKLCRPDVVIAVNVGSPLLKAQEVGSALSVTAQMVAILTEQNVSRSIESLSHERDIYLRPRLDDITAADFGKHAEAAERGREVADLLADRLRTLALSPSAYAEWRKIRLQDSPATPRVDDIEVAGLSRVDRRMVRRHLEQTLGEPLDTSSVNRSLLRAFGDGFYESVDYSLLTQRDRNVLRVTPLEKSWGPDYLRFALNLETNLSQGSTYSLRAGYQKTWLNRWGAELIASGELGSRTGVAIELYQPLDPRQQFFVDASLGHARERADFFFQDQRVSEYRLVRTSAAAQAGINLGTLGQVRLGWRETRLRPSLETGIPVLTTDASHFGGWLATLDLDQLNRLYFPTAGWALKLSYFDPPGQTYSRLSGEGRYAMPLFGDLVLGTRVAYTVSPRGVLPVFDSTSLGGFLNLSAFSAGQLIGDSARYAHVRAERIVGNAPLGLRGDLRFGVALEAAKVGRPLTPTRFGGWLNSTTLYFGGETPVGPIFVGFGYSTNGSSNAYLVIGAP